MFISDQANFRAIIKKAIPSLTFEVYVGDKLHLIATDSLRIFTRHVKTSLSFLPQDTLSTPNKKTEQKVDGLKSL